MEKFVAVFAVLAALLAANVSPSEAQTETYFTAGGELQLSPQKVSEKIVSIVWKYEKNLLAEWLDRQIELTYYNKFEGRSKLDTVTGVLVVRNMTSADVGLYSVEINNKVQSVVYKAVVIQEVPEPTVEVKPLACGPMSESCRLICSGQIAQAGPVTYFWKKDKGEWEQLENIMEILNNKETQHEIVFSCRMKNPVSEKDSKPFKSPFHQEDKPAESSSVGNTVGALIGVLVGAALVILGVFGFRKRETIRKKIRGNGGPPEAPSESQPLEKQGAAESPTDAKDENEVKQVKDGLNHTDKAAPALE